MGGFWDEVGFLCPGGPSGEEGFHVRGVTREVLWGVGAGGAIGVGRLKGRNGQEES